MRKLKLLCSIGKASGRAGIWTRWLGLWGISKGFSDLKLRDRNQGHLSIYLDVFFLFTKRYMISCPSFDPRKPIVQSLGGTPLSPQKLFIFQLEWKIGAWGYKPLAVFVLLSLRLWKLRFSLHCDGSCFPRETTVLITTSVCVLGGNSFPMHPGLRVRTLKRRCDIGGCDCVSRSTPKTGPFWTCSFLITWFPTPPPRKSSAESVWKYSSFLVAAALRWVIVWKEGRGKSLI